MSASEWRESRNAIAKGRIGIEGDNRFAPRGLVVAFQAAWMGYSALMWGTEVGCVRSPYEGNPRGQSWR